MPALALMALVVVGIIAEGYVLSVLWAWFIVPLFHLPALTVPYAIGLALVVFMFTTQSGSSLNTGTRATWPHVRETGTSWFVKLGITLLIGGIVKQFV